MAPKAFEICLVGAMAMYSWPCHCRLHQKFFPESQSPLPIYPGSLYTHSVRANFALIGHGPTHSQKLQIPPVAAATPGHRRPALVADPDQHPAADPGPLAALARAAQPDGARVEPD